MSDFAEWRKSATVLTAKGRLCLDGEAQAALRDAIEELQSAKALTEGLLDGPGGVEALAEEVKRCDRAVQDATRTFVFKRISRGQWRQLEDDHPATDEQRETNPKQELNPATYEPALAAACAADPELTVDDAAWLYDFVPDDEWALQVIEPILRANKRGEQAPKDASAIADRLISGLRSTTAPRAGSPSPSSEVE